MIKVPVDPDKKKIIIDDVYEPLYEHFRWCVKNCEHRWYNECNDYSYICFDSAKDAYKFSKIYAPESFFASEKDEVMFILRWI